MRLIERNNVYCLKANPRSCTWTCALNKNFRSCVPADFDFQAAHEPLQRYTPGRNKLRRPEGGDTTFERHLLRTPTHQLPDSRPAAAAVHHQHAPAEPSAARTEHTYAIYRYQRNAVFAPSNNRGMARRVGERSGGCPVPYRRVRPMLGSTVSTSPPL